MKRLILFIVLQASICLSGFAQNEIDQLVNNYSAISTSKYTSAVERNPKNRAIIKVVKMLDMEYTNVTPFVNAFKKERAQGDFSERKVGDDLIMTLTTQTTKQNRIYMLKAEDYYINGKLHNAKSACSVTIIVKMK